MDNSNENILKNELLEDQIENSLIEKKQLKSFFTDEI